MFCFTAATKGIDTSGTIAVEPQSFASRWIVVGDAAYCEHFFASIMSLRYMLHSPYPNPSRSRVNIRYTVPFGAQERIIIMIYNVLGRLVWEKRIDDLLSEGPHTVTWDGRDTHGVTTGSGLYIIRLNAVDPHGKLVGRFMKSVMLMR